MLLRALARAVLASSCVAGCVGTTDESQDQLPATPAAGDRDAASATRPTSRNDAGKNTPSGRDSGVQAPPETRLDAGGTGQRDGGTPGPDGALPSDAAGPDGPDAGWKSACSLLTSTSLTELRLTESVDFVGIYHQHSNLGGPANAPRPELASESLSRGERCAASETAVACDTRHNAAIRTSDECPPRCGAFALTRVAASNARLDGAAFVSLLGTVDTESEALLLASFNSQALLCADQSHVQGSVGTEIRATAAGYELRTVFDACSGGVFRDLVTVSRAGVVARVEHVVLSPSTCAIGRRPAGLRSAQSDANDRTLGAFLAQIARLEAASVFAFAQLAEELHTLGAPRALIERACAAVCDEERHADAMSELARRFGGALIAPEVASSRGRCALELALDNAVEGCVRETFGALVAIYQAESAADAEVRAAMVTIAADETRHALLSWELAAWFDTQLTPEQRTAVSAARARAIFDLECELETGLTAEDCRLIGFPSKADSARLLSGLSETLWTS